MKKKFTLLLAAVMLLMMMSLPGNAVGQTIANPYTITLSSDVKMAASPGTTSGNVTWVADATGGATIGNYNSGYLGQQFGTGSTNLGSYVTFTTSGITGTISSIVVSSQTGTSGGATVAVSVGGTGYGDAQNMKVATAATGSTPGELTFNGSSSGEIVITLTQTVKKAMYLNSITVNYTSGPVTYTVTYNANGATGSAPTDSNSPYASGATVTVLEKPDGLSKTGHTFISWNTSADTTGTNYVAGNTFTINSNTNLYAKWRPNKHNVTVTGASHGTVSGFTNPVAYNSVVTLTYTHNDGEYYSATFSTSDAAIYGSDNNKFIMPDKDVTITVTETELPVYTVTYSDGGSVTEAHYGAGVTLATRTGDGTYSFAGWTTSNIAEETTTAPNPILTGLYHPTSNVTLYPVYTRSEGDGEKWRKITGNFSTIDAGIYALIAPNGRAFNGTITSGHGQVTSSAFSFDDNNESTTAPTGTLELTLTPVIENEAIVGYTMYNSTNKYLYAKAASTGNLEWHSTESSYWKNYNNYNWVYNTNTAYLRTYTSNQDETTFRTYGNAANAGFSFVKKVSTSVTYYISTLSSIAVPSFNPTSQSFSTASLSVTITAADGCIINYTVDGTDPETSGTAITTDSNSATVTVTETTTIRALAFDGNDFSAEASQTYTKVYNVALSSNGVVGTPIEVVSGESTTLATPSNIPNGYSFRGWTATPASPSTFVSTTYTPSDNVTLYAVFGKVSYGDFAKVTSNQSDWSGNYLIVCETNNKALDGGLIYMNTTKNTIDVTISENKISSNETTNSAMFTIASITGGYSIYSASGKYIGRTANSNGLETHATTQYLNTIAYTSGNTVITSSGGPKLQCWISGSDWKIGYYASSQTAIRLYKQEILSTDGYYIQAYPTNSTTTATADIEITGLTIIESGSVLNMGEYKLTNITEANLIIEDGGQLIVNNSGVQATVKKDISSWGSKGVGGWNFIASPINSETLKPSEVGNMLTDETEAPYSYDLYRYNDQAENSKAWENYHQHNTLADPFYLVNGMGYLYANASGVNLEFSGEVRPSNTTVEVTGLKATYNLVGNPFTCNAYLNTDYYRLVGGNRIEATKTTPSIDNFIAPNTGVIVESTNGGTVKFSKDFPVASANSGDLQMVLAQNVTTRGESRSQTLDNAIVSFNEDSQLGKFYFGTQDANLYIPMDNEEYAIVSSSAQGEMPVNFKAHRDGQYTITVNPQEVEMGYLHLIDNIAGVDVDLLANPSYTFNARYDDYESRFRLVFSANMVNADLNGDFAFFSNGQLVIANEGETILQVIDVNGRIVATESINGTCSKAINAKAGVYVLRLINGTDVKTQKIIVK